MRPVGLVLNGDNRLSAWRALEQADLARGRLQLEAR